MTDSPDPHSAGEAALAVQGGTGEEGSKPGPSNRCRPSQKGAHVDTTTIAETRRNLGISQEVLAQILGIARVTLARWETGAQAPRGVQATYLEVLLQAIQRLDEECPTLFRRLVDLATTGITTREAADRKAPRARPIV